MKLLTFIATAVLALSGACSWAESADRNKPIIIESNTFLGDELRQVAIYSGAVTIDQGTMHMTGNRLEMKESAKGYRTGTLTGNLATFRQKKDQKVKNIEEWINAKAQTIIYEERTGLVTLIGNAEVFRLENGVMKDRAKGSKITYDTVRSRTIIQGNKQGRASTVIAPRSQAQSSQSNANAPTRLNSATSITLP